MADISFTISAPTLISNQGFLIEYKDSTVSGWTTHGIETDNSVTISGLIPGKCYDVRVTFLSSLSPQVGCDSVVRQFCIPSTLPCADVEGEIVADGKLYELNITFTLASPYVAPCSGWKLVYGPITSPQQPYTVVMLSTLVGISPFVIPGVNNVPYYVALYSLDCEGNENLCSEDTVDPIGGGCQHAVLSSAEIVFQNSSWFLKLIVIPSVPASGVYQVTFSQANAVSSGVPDPGGTLIVNVVGTNPETFYIPISPNLNLYDGVISYVGVVIDFCRYSSYFDISYAT